MFSTYETKQGDTFESISRARYGTEDNKGAIASANVGVVEPIPAGTFLTMPPPPVVITAPARTNANEAAGDGTDVAVYVNGGEFEGWQTVEVTRRVDGIDTFTVTAPADFRFRPLSFDPLEVTVGGRTYMSGTMIDVKPSATADRREDAVSGYSYPGVLNDCNAAVSAYPLEFNGLALPQIAKQLLDPFGVSAEFGADSGAPFEQVSINESDKVLTFLINLGQQRGLVLGSTKRGALEFRKPTLSKAVDTLTQGEHPIVSVAPSFSPQQYFSSVTGIEPVSFGLEGQSYTVKNPLVRGSVRPYTYVVNDAAQGDLKAAVEAKASRMFANAVSYSVPVSAWTDKAGALWEPGSTVRLKAPDAKVPEYYEFLIREVSLVAAPEGKSATLLLVLPGSFDGSMPGRMPWDA